MEKEAPIASDSNSVPIVTTNTDKNALVQRVHTKKRSLLQVIRIALYVIRCRSTKGKTNVVHVDVASKGLWKGLLAAMRPLHHNHHHDTPKPPPVIVLPSPTDHTAIDVPPTPISPSVDLFHDLGSPLSSHSDDSVSLYASAVNLQELDKSEGTNCDVVIEEGYFNEDGGDEMIDVRAEEFIVHFYEQMKLQRKDSIHRYNIWLARQERDGVH
ncbi:hypothetical protein GIB67_008717 [Kingdonia uniflora]|uniref:Uncharacterized protein n=1 Tax=Kingdonia uniflora TaxID=39325 RepID=A0A7J7NGC5_9MAGN|nr:hypothetical protein GIB67_008717 [Kingdonia uniflora]